MRMARIFFALAALLVLGGQSTPNPPFTPGFVPSAAQWNLLFSQKQDYNPSIVFNGGPGAFSNVTVNGASIGILYTSLTAIDLDTLGDNAIAIRLPNGVTHFQVSQILVRNSGSVASLTSAQYGLFTASGGGGVALISSGTALSAITSNTANALANMALINSNQTIVLDSTVTNIYFRVTQVQASGATVDVTVLYKPMP